jgi:adenine-specific DNA-methyltransferase
MADLLPEIPTRFRLLDPGAGPGMLTAAVCERVAKLRSPRHLEVHLYENDAAVLTLLRRNVALCRDALLAAGHGADFTIHTDDFVLANEHVSEPVSLFAPGLVRPAFDAIITNPPYFKIAGDSPHAALFRALVHGQPNIYALFLAVAAGTLRPGGALVAITPRSFCNGLYFRGFRHWFLERMTLRHAHLFESRKDAFREAGVLQESLITLTTRLGAPAHRVTMTTSYGREDLTSPRRIQLPAARVIDDSCGDMVIRLPADDIDARIMAIVESWPLRFADHCLKVSTGPVVSFRAREFLVHGARERGTVPLLLVHNVRLFRTEWPLPQNGKPAAFRVAPDSEKMLVPTLNYVLLRRFSAKEERRRLTASCFLRKHFRSKRVALENHLNYVYHAERELTEDETFGLAGLFNSVLLDRYFRMLSGNTQVNATELRTLNFPDLAIVREIGRGIRALGQVDLAETEQVVLDTLGVNSALGKKLLEAARG